MRVEMKRMLTSRNFLAAWFLACAALMLDASYPNLKEPLACGTFISLLDGSLKGQIVSFTLPVAAVLPWCDSFLQEYKSGFLKVALPRTDRRQYVEGSNEVGIVYATDAASVADSVDIIAEAPAGSLQTPVLYPVGMVEDKEASDDDKAAAAAFLEYLQSDEALEVFEKYGFAAYVADDKTDVAAADEETAEPTEEASEDTAE